MSSPRWIGVATTAAGALVLAVSLACSDEGGAREVAPTEPAQLGSQGAGAGVGDGVEATPGAGQAEAEAEAESEARAELDPGARADVVGRAFTDVEPLPEGTDAKPLKPIVLEGFDPSRFTEDALAKNPLEIGTPKREPFQLAEGADPLDPASYDWEKDKDGYWIISYYDLSLEEVDKDLLLDALVYPDEYKGEDIRFPDRLRSLDGKKVALTGYMIAMRWNKDKLKHFMLVRDLKSCCFGQQPEPDEWVDVPMDGPGTHYIQYVPVVTRGIFRLSGSSDDAGYAVGAFKIEGHDSREE